MIMLIGSVGGTVIVTTSKPLLISTIVLTIGKSLMQRIIYETTLNANRKYKNLVDYLWNLFSI